MVGMFNARYAMLICVTFSVFISNLFMIYFTKVIMQKSTRITK
ncbi:hypothetical protein [Campylobacter troglodytis]|nr:hypothetical protein [Campylobacter troglodytis]